MLSINFIKENEAEVRRAIFEKKVDLDLNRLFALNAEKKELLKIIEQLRSEKKNLFDNNSIAKEEKPGKIQQGKLLKNKLAELEPQYAQMEKEFINLMVLVPNITSPDTPTGKDDKDNVEIFRSKEIPKFSFVPKNHIQLGKTLNILDLERGSKVAGYRGYYVMNEGVSLMLGFMMYAMNKMIINGFSPMIVPTLVNGSTLFGSGYFKGSEYNSDVDDIYEVTGLNKEKDKNANEKMQFLVGTAEPSLLSYYAGETLDESLLPLKMCGFSQCYRREIGSYGKFNQGIYRVHEFMKVEQVIILKANVEEANYLQNEMIKLSAEMHKELEIPYRQIQICTGDMGLGKYRMFDIEAWMPGLNYWGETGSASNFLDWQSRRLNVRYQASDGKKKHVFMLNNTALPSPRIFIALLENHQQKDGSIIIPEVIKNFMPVKYDIIRNK
ncbi:MAG: serine--tRNA ligase [Patescibacteria group bacterium]